VGIIHDSDRAATYGRSIPQFASETRLAELLVCLINTSAAPCQEVSGVVPRLHRIANYLRDLASAHTNDFSALTVRLLASTRDRELAIVHDAHAGSLSCPRYVRAALAR